MLNLFTNCVLRRLLYIRSNGIVAIMTFIHTVYCLRVTVLSCTIEKTVFHFKHTMVAWNVMIEDRKNWTKYATIDALLSTLENGKKVFGSQFFFFAHSKQLWLDTYR